MSILTATGGLILFIILGTIAYYFWRRSRISRANAILPLRYTPAVPLQPPPPPPNYVGIYSITFFSLKIPLTMTSVDMRNQGQRLLPSVS